MIGRKGGVTFVFDLDSTLIQQETIDELAKLANAGEKVQQITKRAMEGEIDFKEALKARVSLLKGLNAQDSWSKLIANLKYTEGVEELFRELRALFPDCKIVIASGGFLPLAEFVGKALEADSVFANELATDEQGNFTGELANKVIVDSEFKASLVTENSVAIGDGANDIAMLKKAQLSIAFNGKPVVARAAKHSVESNFIYSILPIIKAFYSL